MKQSTINVLKIFLVSLMTGVLTNAHAAVVDSIVSSGIYRSFRVYIPPAYSVSKAVPLVLNFHGLGSNGFEQEAYTEFDQIADTANFIVAYPDGEEVLPGSDGWNCFATVGTGTKDLQFVADLIDTLSLRYSIDPDRIYATGMSNGGFMSYELACFLGHRIAAVASVTGSMTSERKAKCAAAHITPVMEIHGTADPVVGYDGTNYLTTVPAFTHIDTVVRFWAALNKCSATPSVTSLPDINTSDGSTVEHHVYAGSLYGSTVELYKVIGGAHTWPGSPISIGSGSTNRDFKASAEIWRFFSKYRLSALPTSIAEQSVSAGMNVTLSPNPAYGMIEIKTEGTQHPFDVTVVDMLGNAIVNVRSELPTLSIDMAQYQPGIYLVHIASEHYRKALRLTLY